MSTRKLNILVAYPYFSDKIRSYLLGRDPSTFRLIVDSGAFTAWSTGATITMEGYTNFLRSLPDSWEMQAVQLDVYGNPEKTYTNWKQMLGMGFRDIMPVFTRGDSLDRLDEYYASSKCVMFGGIALGGENKNYIKYFSEANSGRPVHWLGFTSMPFVKHYKPQSVDSSSINSTHRFGTVSYYEGGGVLKTLNKANFSEMPPAAFINSCTDRGFNFKELERLGRKEAWVGSVRPLSKTSNKGLASFVNYTHHVWRSIDVEEHVGTKIYLAVATDLALAGVFDSYDFMKERGTI